MHFRIKLLIAAHVVANAACQLTAPFLPPHVKYLPLLWTLAAIPVGQLFVLAFWLSMGKATVLRRMLTTLAAVGFHAVMFATTQHNREDVSSWWTQLGEQFVYGWLVIVLFVGVFLVVRRWVGRLTHFSTLPEQVPRRFQFTLFHMLLVTSIVAVLLAGGRHLRLTRYDASFGRGLVEFGFITAILVTNVVVSLLATLRAHRPTRPVVVVLLTATLLGLAMGFANSTDRARPEVAWLLYWMPVLSVAPTVTVVATLLVVRSCGYRLVPLRDLRAMHETSADKEPTWA